MISPANTTTGAMRQWFAENPGEYLTLADVVKRFGCKNIAVARQHVRTLKAEGLVQCERYVFADPERPR